MKPRCHYDVERGWLTVEHVRDCDDSGCAGCKPCGKSHCGLRGKCPNHVEQHAGVWTCPSCIGKVRKDLRAVVEHYAVTMRDEAIEAGVDSEAFNLLGPAASVDQLDARRKLADRDRGWCDFPPPDDPHHPALVLPRWDLMLREEYGPATDLFATVTSAAAYIEWLMDTEKSGADFAHTRLFEEFNRDLGKCLRHLESVAHDSRDPEKGAPCPRCAETNEGGKAPRLLKRYGRATDGSADTWHCPTVVEHWWTDVDYRSRVDGDYLEHATALTATQMHEQWKIKPGSLRGWASKGLVAKRGKTQDGLTLYDVVQARQQHEGERVAS